MDITCATFSSSAANFPNISAWAGVCNSRPGRQGTREVTTTSITRSLWHWIRCSCRDMRSSNSSFHAGVQALAAPALSPGQGSMSSFRIRLSQVAPSASRLVPLHEPLPNKKPRRNRFQRLRLHIVRQQTPRQGQNLCRFGCLAVRLHLLCRHRARFRSYLSCVRIGLQVQLMLWR